MRKLSLKDVLLNSLCLVVVIFIMVVAFLYRKTIEQYAATGYLGVFIACFASTSTVFLPAPGILVVLQYSQLLNPAFVILLGGLGTSLGEVFGYMLGRSGNNLIRLSPDQKQFQKFRQHPYFAIFIFSLIPLPIFDIIGICAGIEKVDPKRFWLSCIPGKTIKLALFYFVFSALKEYFPSIITQL